MNKFAPQGIVAQSFSHTSLNTAQQGDLVQLAGDLEVATATAGRPIGRIITVDKHAQLCVVELFKAMIFEVTVGATAVVAGNQVKISAANTVIPVAAGDPLAFAVALDGGATGATITVLPL